MPGNPTRGYYLCLTLPTFLPSFLPPVYWALCYQPLSPSSSRRTEGREKRKWKGARNPWKGFARLKRREFRVIKTRRRYTSRKIFRNFSAEKMDAGRGCWPPSPLMMHKLGGLMGGLESEEKEGERNINVGSIRTEWNRRRDFCRTQSSINIRRISKDKLRK